MIEIRVGFIFYQVGWLGGVNYLRNLFTALRCLPEKTIKPVLFAGQKSDVVEFKGLVEVVRTAILDRYSPLWWMSKFSAKLCPRRDLLLYGLLRKHQIAILSHFGRLWPGCSIKTIGWIPDFQHMHIPSFYSKKDRKAIDNLFLDIINKSHSVIVSSQNALNDFKQFYTSNPPPSYILRFVACLHPDSNGSPRRDELEKKYNLDRPWFHIPNQFWVHKNHSIVLEALLEIKKQGFNPLVIATGTTNDYRNPNYFKSFMKKVREYGLGDDFRSLGVLPYSDVMALMRDAVAIINPSLYEGWSTTVEESKAMGKKILLSDIAVHREQNPERGLYFDVDNAERLAGLMITSIESYHATDENLFQAQARKRQQDNIAHFAKQYESIVLQVSRMK